MARTADRIIYGNIHTVDGERPRAAAAAIAGGRFVCVGDEADVSTYIGENTEVLRFEGGIILPGLGEGHGHIAFGGAMERYMAHLNAGSSLDEYRDILRAHIEKHPDWEVYQGTGFLPAPELYGPYGPTADMLEGLTDRCIVLWDKPFHSCWVNRAALARLGIDQSTPDVSDGVIARDEAGRPTGWFQECAMALIKPLTAFTVEQYKEAILRCQQECLACGTTLFMDAAINWDGADNAAEALRQLDAEGRLRMRAFGAYQVFQAEGCDPLAEIRHAARLREQTRGRMFDLSSIQVQLDGALSPTDATACVKSPYCDPRSQAERYCGQLHMDLETLTAVYKKSHELGFPVHLHAAGDGALAMALEAMEWALDLTGPHDLRDAIAHLEVVDPADIPRMEALGVVAVTDPFRFPMEPVTYGAMAALLGEKRAQALRPMKSFFDAGVPAASASDYPMANPAHPLIGMQRGVTRQLPGRPDTLYSPDERVTIEQMIEATTLNVARQLMCDDRLGSIAVGKAADLVVLDLDITACDPEHITNATVLRTMVGGDWVYTSTKEESEMTTNDLEGAMPVGEEVAEAVTEEQPARKTTRRTTRKPKAATEEQPEAATGEQPARKTTRRITRKPKAATEEQPEAATGEQPARKTTRRITRKPKAAEEAAVKKTVRRTAKKAAEDPQAEATTAFDSISNDEEEQNMPEYMMNAMEADEQMNEQIAEQIVEQIAEQLNEQIDEQIAEAMSIMDPVAEMVEDTMSAMTDDAQPIEEASEAEAAAEAEPEAAAEETAVEADEETTEAEAEEANEEAAEVAEALDACDALTEAAEPPIPEDAGEAAQALPIGACEITVEEVPYTGKKIKKLSVKVKCGDTELKEDEDYTFSFDKKVRDIGLYTLKIKGKGSFTDSAKVPFYVVPREKMLAKLMGGDKRAARDWDDLKRIVSCEIEYSQDKDFSDGKKEEIRKSKDLKKLLKKLKDGNKYYARIRLCATIKDKKYCSDWSKAIAVKP